ncbi:hypothetical protein [Xanthomonas citri]|uniref:hypothetical protein n=1 Tax=Xanthomonas citri TaxID=346 RepID=UPI0001CEC76A|nr:hypothetical protein [Xanthomonas citri]AMU98429.1 hypothetical protein TP37_10240 [Xanthomonas citri pv. aurantifolii]AMV03362.1 hypothetical protein TP50_13635 [Xanthomonas citri pv. aurantifolii]EFF47762.1 conserved hypothetical protein [Xanthomonas citri pv. aurantifolii str. ICPB 10535]MCC8489613.1 hypothetical protein [Xanthomonas citri pv. fuscans]TBW95171.1 hypothetical protein TP47_16700 [Xanthomonas citri pv. aurantifolii]
MLAWNKRGLVFDVARHGVGGWMNHAALTPTPHRLSAQVLRVYAGFRDAQGVSRIGYVDVRADAPTQIVGVSKHPVLDIGRDGCFDDNGMILGDVVAGPDGLYLFYVGFQRVAKAKFLAFTGLAVSHDGGERFQRRQETPLLDRAPGRSTIAAVHSARYEQGRWRLWYAAGDDWETIGGQPYPRYHIRYAQTDDLRCIPTDDAVCLRPHGDEYRIGRPRVYRFGERYLMYFTRGDLQGGYFPGIAFSGDGVHWERDDRQLGLALSDDGWDAQTLCYPALIQHGERVLMFYNGNAMGQAGFGLAEAALPVALQGCHVFG